MVDMTIGRQNVIPNDTKSQTLTSATFVIEWMAGGNSAVFSELAGISTEIEQIEYMETQGTKPAFGRFLGKAKPPTVTLKRSMSNGPDTSWIWAWHAMARSGATDAFKHTTLKLFSAGSDKPVKTYLLSNAIPTKLEIQGMKAGGSEVVLQTVTLQCDAIEED